MKHKNIFINIVIFLILLLKSIKKMNPFVQYYNPVLFVAYLASVFITLIFIYKLLFYSFVKDLLFTGIITIWLWITVLFGNFVETFIEYYTYFQIKRLKLFKNICKMNNFSFKKITKNILDVYFNDDNYFINKGDIILVTVGDIIPCNGKVIKGCAVVNEYFITGKSIPVIKKEVDKHYSFVRSGTKIISNWLIIQASSNYTDFFFKNIIKIYKSIKSEKTPYEIILNIVLIAITIIILLSCITLYQFSIFISNYNNSFKEPISIVLIIALLVCLIPTTISSLLSSITVIGINKILNFNVITINKSIIETIGMINIIFLNKKNILNIISYRAYKFIPASGISERQLAFAALLSSIANDTEEDRSIILLAKKLFNFKDYKFNEFNKSDLIFSSQNNTITGINFGKTIIRKGSVDSMRDYLKTYNILCPKDLEEFIEYFAQQGFYISMVIEDKTILGIILLKNFIKQYNQDYFLKLKNMGIKTFFITNNDKLFNLIINSDIEINVFLSNKIQDTKISLIRKYQNIGHQIAMIADGINDVSLMNEVNVGVAMESDIEDIKKNSNVICLDSDPNKFIKTIFISKEILITRGALFVFSITNDLAKYFAIIPTVFSINYPYLSVLNIMYLQSPNSAMLSTVIFNAIIIIFLVPLIIYGVHFDSLNSKDLLRNNLIFYGLTGLITPFIGIKIIDLLINIFYKF